MKKRGKNKAQVSLEFLMVMGFAFLMIIPLTIIFYQQSATIDQEITAGQVDKVASEIRDAADEVFYLGAPSKKTVTVYLSEGVQSISISGSRIVFTVSSPGGDYEVVKWSAGNVSGSIQAHKGIHVVTVEAFDTYVSISD